MNNNNKESPNIFVKIINTLFSLFMPPKIEHETYIPITTLVDFIEQLKVGDNNNENIEELNVADTIIENENIEELNVSNTIIENENIEELNVVNTIIENENIEELNVFDTIIENIEQLNDEYIDNSTEELSQSFFACDIEQLASVLFENNMNSENKYNYYCLEDTPSSYSEYNYIDQPTNIDNTDKIIPVNLD